MIAAPRCLTVAAEVDVELGPAPAFEAVIPPHHYDWGWPFENGRALVCLGCREGEPEGEHRPVVGGRWGYVDKSGEEVVPVRLSRSEALELVLVTENGTKNPACRRAPG